MTSHNNENWLYCSKCYNQILEYKNLCFYIDLDGVFLEILKDENYINNNNNNNNTNNQINNNNNTKIIVNQLPNYDRYELVSKSNYSELYYSFDETKNDLLSMKPFIMCTSIGCENIIGYFYLNQIKKIFSFRLDHSCTTIELDHQSNDTEKPWKYYLNKSKIIDNIKVYRNNDLNYNGFLSTGLNNNNNNTTTTTTTTTTTITNTNNNNNINNNLTQNLSLFEIKEKNYKSTIFTSDNNKPEIPKFIKNGATTTEPKLYQIECYYQCIKKNTLLVLPTGMGKTLIATMTLLEMYRLNGSGSGNDNNDSNNTNIETKRVALFLVDRVPLVTQQAEAIESKTELKVCKLYGEINNNSKKEEVLLKDYDVLVSTVGSLVNLLEINFLNISDFYFITFDEVHHATGNHSYNRIIEFIRTSKINTRPRLLGLTASLISNHECKSIESAQNSIKRMEQLMLSDVYKPISLISDIDTNNTTTNATTTTTTTNEIKPELLPFESSIQENLIEKILSEFLVSKSKLIQEKLNYSDIDLESILINDSNGINSTFSLALERLLRFTSLPSTIASANITSTTTTVPTNLELIRIEINHLIDLYKLFSILSTLGPKETLVQLNSIIDNVNDEISFYHHLLSLKYDIIGQYDDDQFNFQKFSTRYNCLLNSLNPIIENYNNNNNNNNNQKNLRIIIFVETRIGALNLTTMLKKESFNDILNCKRLVGHNGDDGMDSEKQQKIIKKFKDGKCKLIVSTNVLEEGIDIQELDLVICYDGVNSLKSLIQRRGRARSKDKSKFIIIYNKSRHLKILDILSSENILNNSINEMILKRNDSEIINNNFLNWKVINKIIGDIKIERESSSSSSLLASKDDGSDGANHYLMLSIYHINDFNWFKEFLLLNGDFDSSSFTIRDIELVAMKIDDDDQYLSNFIIVTLKCNNETLAINQFKSLLQLNGFNFWLINKSFYLSSNSEDTQDDDDDDDNNISLMGSTSIFKIHFKISKFEYGNMLNPTTFYKIDELPNEFHLVFSGNRIELTNSMGQFKCILRLKDIETNLLYVTYDDNDDDRSASNKVDFFLIVKRPLSFETKVELNNGRVYWNKSPPVKSNFGTAFVYRFTMSTQLNQIDKFIEPLIKNGFKIFDCSLTILNDHHHHPHQRGLNLELNHIKKDLEILYLLNCLNSQSSFGRVLSKEFIEIINKFLGDGNKREQCKFIISSLISKKTKFIDLVQYSKDCLKYFKKDEYIENRNQISTKDGEFSWIREVYITPSRTIFIEPTLQRTCRTTRYFGSDNFILVKFTNELLEPIAGINSKHPTFKAIESIFFSGLNISNGNGFDCYKYVGNSNSQLREFSAWFVNCSKGLSDDKVRRWSEIEHIDPRKYFRSIGLVFSNTIPTIRIPKNNFYIIDDIERNGHNFTEGCGQIGSQLAKILNETYGFKASTCAYQVRIGGAKGMLVVNNRLSNPLGVYIRKSMVKFSTMDSDHHRTLEICSVSTTSRCRLNRQVISLLSTLGTKDSVFFSLQDHYLNQLANIVSDTNTSKQLIGEFFPDITESELYQDTYIRRILISLYKLKMQRIQQKCSIEVQDSRMLLGVADPTNKLNPNTVYAQIEEEDPMDGHKYDKVITGLVMVIKNPCTHPGDVRYLTAVDNPELKHLKNVLVFSTQGDVPNFKEISGSDLDGDRYFFCYDKQLIGDRRESYKAYLGDDFIINNNNHNHNHNHNNRNNHLKRINQNSNVQVDSTLLNDIYFDNVERQQLGSMYNSHLAICDLLKATNPLAIEISKECFKEIDYAKTGIHGNIPKEAIDLLNKQGYPHYMIKENSTKTYYPSKTIMGLMYDQIDHLVYIGDFLPDIVVDESKLVQGYESFLENAKILYREYKTQVNSLLRRYRTGSEESLLIGLFDNTGASFEKISKEVTSEMKGDYKKIQQSFVNEFLKEFGEEQKDTILLIHRDNIEKKIAAWYSVAYSDSSSDRVLGFYWIARSFKQLSLLEDNQKRRNVMVNSILDYMSKKKSEILPLYQQRVLLVDQLNQFLKSLTNTIFENSSLHIIGSTCTLTFSSNSNLNLYLRLYDENTSTNTLSLFNEKIQILNQLKDEFKSSSNSLLNGISNCSIINTKESTSSTSSPPPLLKFSNNGIEILIGLEENQMNIALIQQQYIFNDPSILSLLLCIIDWGVESTFIPTKELTYIKSKIQTTHTNTERSTLVTTNLHNLTKSNMISLFIQFCIETRLIKKIDELHFLNSEKPTSTNLTIGNWEKLFDISSRYISVEQINSKLKKKRTDKNTEQQPPPHEEYDTSNLGDTILSFFRFYSDTIGLYIYENWLFELPSFIINDDIPLNPKIEAHKSTLLYFQDSFRHALHSLSTFVKIDDFLSNCFKATKKVMKLNPNQLKILQNSSVRRDIIKKVQNCGCSIFIKTNDKDNASIEIEGSSQQIRHGQNEIRSILSIKYNNHDIHHNYNKNHHHKDNFSFYSSKKNNNKNQK